MDLTEALRAAGFEPTLNTDGEFLALKGTYKAEWVALRPEKGRDSEQIDRYHAEWLIKETLEGTQAVGRKLFRNYWKFSKDGQPNVEDMKKLCNDAFTVGVSLETSSDPAFEETFFEAGRVLADPARTKSKPGRLKWLLLGR